MAKAKTKSEETGMVAKPDGSPPAVYDPKLLSGWGGMEGIDAQDVMIPKLLIMQPISERVTDRQSVAGEIVRSTTGEKLGDEENFVELIPLKTHKLWVLMKKDGQKYEFQGTEPFSVANADAPWEFQKGGETWQRNQAINLFALLPADIKREAEARKAMEQGEMPDVSAALLPVVVQFMRTSFKVGREVVTHFARSTALGVPAACNTLRLYTEYVKGEKGSFYIYKLMPDGRRTTPDELERAKSWYLTISKASEVKVDDRDLGGGPAPAGGEENF